MFLHNSQASFGLGEFEAAKKAFIFVQNHGKESLKKQVEQWLRKCDVEINSMLLFIVIY